MDEAARQMCACHICSAFVRCCTGRFLYLAEQCWVNGSSADEHT